MLLTDSAGQSLSEMPDDYEQMRIVTPEEYPFVVDCPAEFVTGAPWQGQFYVTSVNDDTGLLAASFMPSLQKIHQGVHPDQNGQMERFLANVLRKPEAVIDTARLVRNKVTRVVFGRILAEEEVSASENLTFLERYIQEQIRIRVGLSV